MKILFDPKKCTACGACAVACMDENDVDIPGGQQPYRKVYRTETGGVLRCHSDACLHCPTAPCAVVCPQGCLRHDAALGLTLLDNSECIGCMACLDACPVHAPTFREGKMEKCHGCATRVQAGLLPVCVRNCPTGALRMGN